MWVFKLFDRNANQVLTYNEVSRLLKQVYKTIDWKKKFTNEDVDHFYKIFNKKNNEGLVEKDFEKKSIKYFGNTEFKGCKDIYLKLKDKFEIIDSVTNKSKDED